MKASKNENLPLDHKLQNFLLTYRSTPHSTTNVAPADLFLGRSIRTRLHLLKDLRELVEAQQAKQKDHHDVHTRLASFQLNQDVMVKNRRAGPNWISGSIVQQVAPVTYLVKVGEGSVWKCHADQLKNYQPTTKLAPTVPYPHSDSDFEHFGDTTAQSDTDADLPPSGVDSPPQLPAVQSYLKLIHVIGS